jgi:transcriptional regulator GlxA family with amidase domain
VGVSTRLDAVTDWATAAQSARYKCENIAAAYLVSDRHLERYFLKRFEVSPKQWMQSLRMEIARTLLRRGYSTKAAAEELCYEGASQFCREFKKHFGRSPQDLASSLASRVWSRMSGSAKQMELSFINGSFEMTPSWSHTK